VVLTLAMMRGIQQNSGVNRSLMGLILACCGLQAWYTGPPDLGPVLGQAPYLSHTAAFAFGTLFTATPGRCLLLVAQAWRSVFPILSRLLVSL